MVELDSGWGKGVGGVWGFVGLKAEKKDSVLLLVVLLFDFIWRILSGCFYCMDLEFGDIGFI